MFKEKNFELFKKMQEEFRYCKQNKKCFNCKGNHHHTKCTHDNRNKYFKKCFICKLTSEHAWDDCPYADSRVGVTVF